MNIEYRQLAPGEAGCSHRPPCPGCPRFGEPGIAAAARATLEGLARQHGLAGVPEVGVPAVGIPQLGVPQLSVPAVGASQFDASQVDAPPVDAPQVGGTATAFRLRARLALRGRRGSPKVGMFEQGTHRVVHIPNCRVHHPLINEVAAVVRRSLVDAGVTCYSDKARQGLARYLQVVVERSSQTAQVVLVANSLTSSPLAPVLDLIRDRLGAALHSLWFNSNVDAANRILGEDFEQWSGPGSVVEHFGGAAIHYPPGAFGQSNLAVAQLLVEHVRRHVPSGARVAEFYAGVGAIGLSLLAQAGEIRLNEMNPHSLRGIELGLEALDGATRARISVFPGTAGAAHAMAADAQVVIVDPPRKGLDGELAAALRVAPPERVIYVSCGLESLLRDTALLTSHGQLRLTSLTAFDMLPFTGQVETVACFDRL